MFVAPNVLRFADTDNVYLLRSAGEAILIDFGSGDVLDSTSASSMSVV